MGTGGGASVPLTPARLTSAQGGVRSLSAGSIFFSVLVFCSDEK